MPQKTVFPMKTSNVQIPPLSAMELSPQKKEKEKRKGIYHCRDSS